MNETEALDYLRKNSRAVLSTIKQDGRPQMSLVDYGLDTDGLIKVQTTRPAAKTNNVRRDPRVSFSVVGENWYQYLVIEGTARLIEDNPLPALRHVYELIAGQPHPDWDEFNQAMIDEQQLVMAVEIERMYPISV
jgi:PPOX class probable F420-dependent enzyme